MECQFPNNHHNHCVRCRLLTRLKCADYLHQKTKKEFELVCIIPIDKYNNFPLESKSKIESLTINGFEIKDSRVKDPNNPANLINCKLIKFVI